MNWNWLTGTPASVESHNNFLPQQQNIINQAGQMGLKGLQGMNTSFAPIEAKARKDFAQTTVPGIAERFTGMGAQDSSAFGQQLGGAGAGLETDLAAMGADYNQKQQGFYGNMMQMGLTPQLEHFRNAAQPGLLQALFSAIPALAGGIGGGLTGGLGGGLGALLGNRSNQQLQPAQQQPAQQQVAQQQSSGWAPQQQQFNQPNFGASFNPTNHPIQYGLNMLYGGNNRGF